MDRPAPFFVEEPRPDPARASGALLLMAGDSNCKGELQSLLTGCPVTAQVNRLACGDHYVNQAVELGQEALLHDEPVYSIMGCFAMTILLSFLHLT